MTARARARRARRGRRGTPRAHRPAAPSGRGRGCAVPGGARGAGARRRAPRARRRAPRAAPPSRSRSIRASSAASRLSSSRAAAATVEGLVREVGERRAAPERERLAEPVGADPASRSNRSTSSSSGSTRTRYPGGRVTIRSAPSAPRSAWTCTWSAFWALAGGDSPQIASIRRSVETTSFGWSSSCASSERGLGPPSATGTPSSPTTSSGPSKRNSNALRPLPALP